jgi:alpha-1,2-mannosyltransferase
MFARLVPLVPATITLVVLPLASRYLVQPDAHTDFHFIFLGATALLHGLDPYDPAALQHASAAAGNPVGPDAFTKPFRRWTHPPFSGLLVAPMTQFGEAGAFFIYYLANLFGVVAAFLLGVRLAGAGARARYAAALCAATTPICTSLGLGQVNGFIMAALTVSAWALERCPRQSAILAGVPIGLAAGLKILPGIFVAYFLVTRRWAAAAWALGAGLATLAAPAVVFGPDTTLLPFLRSLGQIAAGSPDMDNMSLPALILRLHAGLDGLDSGLTYPLPPAWGAASTAISLGLVAWGLWRARTQAIPAAYLTLIVVVLLAAPVAWDHYAAWILPFALGPLASSTVVGAEARRKVLILAFVPLTVLPLHWLFRAAQLPDMLAALPWWQLGLFGVLVVSAAGPLRGTACRNRLRA